MREVDLRSADLNLLVVLDALLEERNVTRASLRLGMSQPATSRALARLRAMFSDSLLVDGPGGYLLTARAEQLRPLLRSVLADARQMLDAPTFDPRAATGTVRLLMLDLEAAVLTPRLIGVLAERAPLLGVEVKPPGAEPLDVLAAGEADAVIGVIDEAPAGIRKRTLYADEFATIMRTGHPAAGEPLSLAQFLELEHIVVSITGMGRAWIDEVLGRQGLQRRVKVRVPSFFAALEIAAQSDLVMTLPHRLVETAAGMGRFAVARPPLDAGRVVMSLAWHARNQDDPRHSWLRKAIVAATARSEDERR